LKETNTNENRTETASSESDGIDEHFYVSTKYPDRKKNEENNDKTIFLVPKL
jgi:hypothetical protein